MKKKLIAAGAASFAVAAMPVVGVFAADEIMTVKDSLTVNVSSSCELANITPSGVTEQTPNNYYGTGSPNQLVTLTAGTKVSPGSGTPTSVVVHCNDSAGYTISATFTDLSNGTEAQKIGYSATAATAGSKTWTAYSDAAAQNDPYTHAIDPATGIIGSSTMTDSYTFGYKVGLHANQGSGDYTGSATYTLAGNTP